MPKTIIYANLPLIEKYLDSGQRARIKENSETGDLFPVGMHFIHNDGPDCKVEFIINMQGNKVLCTMPLDVFNQLPRYTPTEEEEAEAVAVALGFATKGIETGRMSYAEAPAANTPKSEEADEDEDEDE